jgi:hypothetical protein
MRLQYDLIRDIATIPGFTSIRPVQTDALHAAQAFCAVTGWQIAGKSELDEGLAVELDSGERWPDQATANAWRACLFDHGVKARGGRRLA